MLGAIECTSSFSFNYNRRRYLRTSLSDFLPAMTSGCWDASYLASMSFSSTVPEWSASRSCPPQQQDVNRCVPYGANRQRTKILKIMNAIVKLCETEMISASHTQKYLYYYASWLLLCLTSLLCYLESH